ncbi:MAG: PorV/PorQ family protein [Elusimicrobiaceae bacterium]
MVKLKNILSAAVFSLAVSSPVFSSGEGTSAAKFLKADTGARASAMGGAFTAVSDDSDAINYNPAGLAGLKASQAMLTHNEWLSGFKQENLSFARPVRHGAFGIGLTYFHSGGIDETDMSGSYTGGSFDQTDMALTAGYGFRASRNLFLGFSGKAIRESLAGHSATGFAADGGALYTMSNLRLGASVRNVGSSIKLYEDAFPLPLTIRGGAAYNFGGWLVSAEAEKPRDGKMALKAGTELVMDFMSENAFSLRAGYVSGRDENTGPGFTGGVGIRFSKLMFDYAFSPFGDLGNSHRFSLVVNFGGTVSRSDDDDVRIEDSEIVKPAAAVPVSERASVPPPAVSEPATIVNDSKPAVKSGSNDGVVKQHCIDSCVSQADNVEACITACSEK